MGFVVTVKSLPPRVSEPPLYLVSCLEVDILLYNIILVLQKVTSWSGRVREWPESSRVSITWHLPAVSGNMHLSTPGLWRKWFLAVVIVRLFLLPALLNSLMNRLPLSLQKARDWRGCSLRPTPKERIVGSLQSPLVVTSTPFTPYRKLVLRPLEMTLQYVTKPSSSS